MSDQTVLLVWEGRDLRGLYADTEKGRAAADRLRASVQAEYDDMDRLRAWSHASAPGSRSLLRA